MSLFSAEFRSKRRVLRAIAANGFGMTTALLGHAQTDKSSGVSRGFGADQVLKWDERPWTLRSATEPIPTQALLSTNKTSQDWTDPRLDVHLWSRLALKLVVKYQQNPLRASRMLAYLHVSMNDAWQHVCLEQPIGSSDTAMAECAQLAMHQAACRVLEHFYPNETPGQFAAYLAPIAAALVDSPRQWQLWAQRKGLSIANQLIERSLKDGAGRVWPIKNRPADFPGIWQPSYPLYAVNPTEAFAGEWRTWVTPNINRYAPPLAPRPGTRDYADETALVLATSQGLTPAQMQAANYWHLESGSVTPPGLWIDIALREISQATVPSTPSTSNHRTKLGQALVVLSAVSVAMHDAFIACWKIKYRDWSERPITAIRRTLDPGFIPLLVTPGFPAYVSGHATISAAAAAVLSVFWPEQSARFKAMAQQAADSRLWGGIHFQVDNEEGLRLGESVGRDLVAARTQGS